MRRPTSHRSCTNRSREVGTVSDRTEAVAKRSDTDVDAVDETEERPDAHLADLEDGTGCTEIWEHLSEQREKANADD